VVKSADLKFISSGKRFVDGDLPYEYIKIADGCDRYCTYCTIPYIRGRYRSRNLEDIIVETKALANLGKKEIILVSQEGSGYGRDLIDGTNIIQLLEELKKIPDIEWIRLMYLHPESLSNELIDYLSQSEKVLGYYDIPFQHINDNILAKMNRNINKNQIIEKLNRIRDNSPNNVIRTTFITGFPGETEKEFDELHNFIEDCRFDRLGVFKYSAEEGTEAFNMENRVPDDIAEERQDLLMSLQQEIAFEKNIGLIDSIQKVIIDEIKADNIAVARSKGDCPEIDQTVFIRNCGRRVGDIIDVRIIMADGYDLIAVERENE
jgi:ribosomal protein S12 methylthiotransferase